MEESNELSYKVYKLNIFADSCEIWTESSLSPFVHINPIYIKILDNDDVTRTKILKIIAKNIIDSDHYSHSDEFIFSILDPTYWMNETDIEIKNNFDLIFDFLLLNELVIFQKSTGKYWCRIYIEFTETSNKGNKYTNLEIKNYVRKQFGNVMSSDSNYDSEADSDSNADFF